MDLEKFRYFIGKPITVFTVHIGRKFTENQFNDYFTGICQSVHIDGIETLHPITGCKNFFFFSNIVGICEEQQLDPDNPEHQEIISEFNNNKSEKPVDKNIVFNNGDNIDINNLNMLLKPQR